MSTINAIQPASAESIRPPLSVGEIDIRLAVDNAEESRLWDEFVLSVAGCSVCHLFGWKNVIERAYRQRTFYLVARAGNRIQGVLPLVLTRSPLFGVHLTSMPYMDYGGILAGDATVRSALLREARNLCTAHKAALNLRYLERPELDLTVSLKRVTMLLELGSSLDALWSRLPSERRNRIRKGQKNGLVASWHADDGLREFYDVFARNMRDLGSPVHGLAFFRNILQYLGDRAAIQLVRDGETVIGAAFCLFMGDQMSIPWISSLRPHFKRCPNQILYWEAMRYGIENGYQVLDFGRSARGDGTFEAKRQWGAEPAQLHWVYEPGIDDGESGGAESYGKAARVWRRLPVPLTKMVGPWIRRGVPG